MAASMDSSPPSSRKNNLSLFSSSCRIAPGRLREPFVMKNPIRSWPCSKWNVSALVEILGTRKLRFRIGPRNISTGSVLWEGMCSYQEATLTDFHEWCTSAPGEVPAHNPLQRYSQEEYWCYADYKYMKELFPEQKDILEAVRWGSFGLDSYSGEQSTLWVGSAGAHTVCHQDTYGFNLVAQIQGRKKWYLFPPEQRGCLYPTRIPYEESSVFSEVNIPDPDLRRHPEYCRATPYVVTLEPGDVLYVPREWWHYVECLETSVSINCWVELPADDYSRVQESIVRLLACRILKRPEQCSAAPTWLNPTETITSHETNLLYLKKSLDVFQNIPKYGEALRTRASKDIPPHSVKKMSTDSTSSRKDDCLTKKETCSESWKGDSVGDDVSGDSPAVGEESSAMADVDEGVKFDESWDGWNECPVCGVRRPVRKTEDRADATVSSIGGESVAGERDFAAGLNQCIAGGKKLCTGSARGPEFEIQPLYPVAMETLISRNRTGSQTESDDEEENTLEEMLVQSVTDPRVVSMVTELLLERVRRSKSKCN